MFFIIFLKIYEDLVVKQNILMLIINMRILNNLDNELEAHKSTGS